MLTARRQRKLRLPHEVMPAGKRCNLAWPAVSMVREVRFTTRLF